jgi:hypothetical protein
VLAHAPMHVCKMWGYLVDVDLQLFLLHKAALPSTVHMCNTADWAGLALTC